jgi:Cu/Ag efflux protein CusF
MNFGYQIAILLGITLAAPAFAQKPSDGHSAHRAGSAPKAPSPTEGEVRKVDKAANKVTLKHGPIPSIDMPAMTMVFQAKDPKMLEKLKAGDKVRFTAEKIAGQYVATTVEQRQ